MLTGAEDVRVAVEALRSGAQEFLPKIDANFRKLPNAILSAMERKQQELNFLDLVNNDSLTGVTSRHCFLELLDKSLLRAERNHRTLALMFIDVDDFKIVNDTHGHEAGDFVLKEVAARIKSGMRNCDTLARLGGDEFVVLLEDLNDENLTGCSAVAGRLVNSIQATPFHFNDKDITVDISMGIATYPQMASSKTELIDMADQAMYKSKRSVQDYFTFARDMVAA
jgi:diguanylate cyclase (GGDEF)-like protein